MNYARRCVACGSLFHPLSHVPNQRYCSAPNCQRERRRRWQRQHMRADEDYRENQHRAQASWRARHPDYWRQYRATHPAYRERNAVLQRERNARQRSLMVANMDASQIAPPLASGVYILRRMSEVRIAKMNACIVHLTVLSPPGGSPAPDCKEMM
ncbi:hypothetical protein F3J20_30635 [Paraburkholderia sp. Cy-641]|uniref:hypothetical protein n=1 Tax=Paraburkholderia sp. Cy-641 TaxID=2608337 RepID=UPI001420CC09|nr:hypothetical protein [Paraburkholderia sp. Cy-641]NIF81673.1 hypothetical protein [Paraburkholderia sp. Cy-641]